MIYGRPQRFSGEISVNSVGRLFRGEVFLGVGETADPIRPSRGIRSLTVLSDWDLDATPPRGDVIRLSAAGLQRLPL